jgi:hypothetical protein
MPLGVDSAARRRIACALIAAGLLLGASPALPQAAAVERYTVIPASADGIGKRYMGREIAGVMGWQGAAWLEREEREREERTDLIRVGIARHAGLASPVSGTWVGAPTDYLGMSVDVQVTKR